MDGINSFLHDSSILVLHSILVWTALGFRFSTTAHEISSGSNCTDASLIRGRSHVHFKMRFSRNISSYLVYSTHWALGRKKAGFLDTTGAGHQQDALDGHGQVTLFPFFLKRCFECPWEILAGNEATDSRHSNLKNPMLERYLFSGAESAHVSWYRCNSARAVCKVCKSPGIVMPQWLVQRGLLSLPSALYFNPLPNPIWSRVHTVALMVGGWISHPTWCHSICMQDGCGLGRCICVLEGITLVSLLYCM